MGGIAFVSSFISLIPQIIETYKVKNVKGLSIYFLLLWLIGDVICMLGAILTKQLLFQILLTVFFLLIDLVLCLQYYYYGFIYNKNDKFIMNNKNPILLEASPSNEFDMDFDEDDEIDNFSNKSKKSSSNNNLRSNSVELNSITKVGLISSFLVNTTTALPIILNKRHDNDNSTNILNVSQIGMICAWFGGIFYILSRLPQLFKNFNRKSTFGVSPFLFYCMLISNITYLLSLFTNERYFTDEKKSFINNAMPFIVSNIGTIFLDCLFFVQYYIYKDSRRGQTISDSNNDTNNINENLIRKDTTN